MELVDVAEEGRVEVPKEAGSLSALLCTHRGWMLNLRGDFLCECVL